MNRKALTIVGIVMVLLGSGILIYRGYDVTREETVLNIGSLDVKATTKEHISIPTPLGWILVVGGVVIVAGGAVFKRS